MTTVIPTFIGIGLLIFYCGAFEWFAPEYHRLPWVDPPDGAGEVTHSGLEVVAGAGCVFVMYLAGIWFLFGWIPVFDRLEMVLVQLLSAFGL
ncbi:hypothetical protein E6P09_10500 [Haloferax mediterranei ATCC 33500]|nr:hypothetical protein [Haloferax mediterranei]EMA03893.1 hypothetical protein C439_03008 [Haloferax mediterranei ATCC 33500]MDX5989303.1 hypothetical protein [Haloferax mediterranei ATCC 33500]QCQ75671.1 hypothetical protein E6P09_10500 [Haloferax mediterranei ATCC 33500]